MDHQSRPVPERVPLAVLLKRFLSALPSIWPRKNAKRPTVGTTCSLTIEAEILSAMLGDAGAAEVKRLSNIRKGILDEKRTYAFDFMCRICFRKISCGTITMEEFAIELHDSSTESLEDEDLLNLMVKLPHKDSDAIGGYFRAVHPLVEKFLAAVYLIQRPHMEIFEFVTEGLPTSDDGMTVVKILAGLSYDGGWNDTIRSTLPQVMNSLLTKLLPVNEPVILSDEFFHILDCVAESQNKALYRMLLQKFPTARTVVFRDEDLKLWSDVLAPFIVCSLPNCSNEHWTIVNEHWTIHCCGGGSNPEVAQLLQKVEVGDGYIIVGDLATIFMAVDRDLVILTTRKADYLRDTLFPMLRLRLSHGAYQAFVGKLYRPLRNN